MFHNQHMFQVTIVRLISKLLHFTSIIMAVAFHSNEKKKRLLVTRFPNLFHAIIPKKRSFSARHRHHKKRDLCFIENAKEPNDFRFHNFGFVSI